MTQAKKKRTGSAIRESSKWYVAIVVLNIIRMVAAGIDVEIPQDGPLYDIIVGVYGTIMGFLRYFSKGRRNEDG